MRVTATFEFHISRRIRARYGLDEGLFAFDGSVILADFQVARDLAHRLNQGRDLAREPELAVKASELNALGLIDETLHLMIARYRQQTDPRVLADALEALESRIGADRVDGLLETFVDEFPPLAVWRGEVEARDWLAASTAGLSHREVALEEMLLLAVANENPAFRPFRELFDDDRLRQETAYVEVLDVLETFFSGRPEFVATGQKLLDLLRAPLRAAPDSLDGQLRFLRTRWGGWLGTALRRLLGSLDFLAEESKPFFGFGPGPIEVPVYPTGDGDGDEPEPEAYSADLDWMPSLVLLAKNVHVWLHQLSDLYGREIRSLDRVPDAELDVLARRGFTGLWLIGLWQRSAASARIKHWMGDHEAVASAYSLDDYRIADNLGGQAAFDDLKRRAWQRGIRMASDMVPNHVGIDSRWVIEHPDWFVQRRDPPFPGYSFTGADLCDNERVGIYLEDHYWSRSDAAVVFKRVDHWTGDVRYIYHGNDGTSMPWNDTAQLDYRNPEVREAVIQTILHVARLSPVIRFDAAMTLAKKHVQRLWFPEPGTGGDIPSRAEFGMTKHEFDTVMPQEFWREVVDRVAVEAPDTLLLAEAFWMLEGYFVRSLGMHRVYNSAFMNMLRDERNAEYRQLIKNTLEYDPQILKRYVNFMSNPDERTAIDQFGSEGKYFGVATLMATLPGLPMFGHGQVEGFAEKYGMEFQRPRWQERANDWLVRRHERQIFPLLHRRRMFAEVDDFLLYDFEHADGGVDENVFAYSNHRHGQRSLVVYNNRFGDTRGRIRMSTAVAVKDGDGVRLERTALGAGLGLSLEATDNRYLLMRDVATGLESLRPVGDLATDGLWFELGAYGLHVFCDLQVVEDHDGRWRVLHDRLGGRGVPSLEEGLREIELADVLAPLRTALEPDLLRFVLDGPPKAAAEARSDLQVRMLELLRAVRDHLDVRGDPTPWVDEVVRVAGRLERNVAVGASQPDDPQQEVVIPAAVDLADRAAMLGWAVIKAMTAIAGGDSAARFDRTRTWLDEWLLARTLERALAGLEAGDRAERAVKAVRLAAVAGDWADIERDPATVAAEVIEALLSAHEGRLFLGVNRFDGVLWFRAEALEEAWQWLQNDALLTASAETAVDLEPWLEAVATVVAEAGAASNFRVEDLLAFFDPSADPEELPPAADDGDDEAIVERGSVAVEVDDPDAEDLDS